MMCTWLCLACDLRTTNHEPVYGIRHIGERIIRGCASAVLRDCNMIELVHAKLTHTYAATRRLIESGMHVGRASVMLSVFQFLRFVWTSWRREGYWIPPTTCNSGRLHNLMSAVNRYHQSADVTRVVFSREHRLHGRWGQKSRTRLYSLHCYSHTQHILAHWHTPLPYTNPQTPNLAKACKRLHNPTDPYMTTTHTYSTPTKHNIPTLHLHTCTTVTTNTTLQPLQHNTHYDLHCELALPLHKSSMSMWLASEAAIC